MALAAAYLPFSTEYDPTDDPPTSVDPLGTLAAAERFAEFLLPGFTSRMWRPRLVTFATVAAEVADRVVRAHDGKEQVRTPARLAFERLYVTAIVRATRTNPQTYAGATRMLPGNRLAAAAFDSDEPLVTSNFLRGQGVNGPSGVMVRLARDLSLVDDRCAPARNASKLLAAWAADRGLLGLLDEDGRRPGAEWMARAVKHTVAAMNREWPGPNQQIWERLATHLRPDRVGRRERTVLLHLLDEDAVRARFLRELVAIARKASGDDRGQLERAVLLRHVRPRLGSAAVDRQIAFALQAIDAYESAAALIEQGFDALRWGLGTQGQASLRRLLARPAVARLMTRTRARLPSNARALGRAVEVLRKQPPPLGGNTYKSPLEELRDVALRGAASNDALADAILERHEQVQADKDKGTWIDRGGKLTLMPGFGIGGDEPPVHEGAFRHAFRIRNAFAFLHAMKRIHEEVPYGEG